MKYRIALNRVVLGVVEISDVYTTDPRAEAYRKGIIKNRLDIHKTELWLFEEPRHGIDTDPED